MANYGYAVPHQRSRVAGKIDRKTTGPGLLAYGAMAGWWRVSDLALADGTVITSQSWLDRSGGAHPLTKGNTTGPTYRANYYNSQPYLEFGLSGATSMAASGRVAPLTELTIFVVLDWTGGGRVLGLENSGNGAAGLALYQGSLWIIRDTGSFDISITANTGKQILALQLGVGGGKAWKNGTAGNTTAHTLYLDAGVNLHLGSGGSADNGMSGKVAELAIYSVRLTDAQMASVFADLNARYAIY